MKAANGEQNDASEAEKDVFKRPDLQGRGFHPAFHGLWHLKALGVVDDLSDFSMNHWPKAAEAKPVRVVLIDTPVAYDHPNLKGAIDLALMRDFSVYDEGVFAVAVLSDDADKARRKTYEAMIRANKAPSAAEAAFLAECEGKGCNPKAAPKYFGAHGTAMAGLIGGRPTTAGCVVAKDRTDDTSDPVLTEIDDRVLPYAGVNPYCSIVPVSTTAAPEPSMVLAALDYARLIEPDVVVIAAAWDDTEVYAADMKDPAGKWAAVDAALKKLARKAIVLCAAGNSGKIDLAYPALLAKKANLANLIAVTACDANGELLDYAPHLDTPAQMVMALSSSGMVYDSQHIIHDPWEKAEPEVGKAQDDPVVSEAKKKELPLHGLISLDVPGPYGYNPSPYSLTPKPEGPHLDVGSLYCRFSGTSAATAVAAGLISLAMQFRSSSTNKTPQTPVEAKKVTGMLTLALAQELVG